MGAANRTLNRMQIRTHNRKFLQFLASDLNILPQFDFPALI
jgi:hypothetical protein